ncbi:MAG TPA: tetratricopeptide repeat protein [Kofleriaceae bacterium]|nr:tetratricopeptide repeat protein [Kofleriaceae bacterium]
MAINKNKVMDAARKARDKGQVDKAIKEYLKIVREDPKDVRVWLKIGDLYAKKGAKAEATETYLKVAKFYSEQGFYLKAVAVYKQILKLDPRLVEVNLKLAELYRQLGLLSDAMQHFEMVAAFFHREGKTREALATIRQLVDLDPENVATRIKLAELYSKEGMVEDAVTEFGHACEYLRKHNRLDDFIKVAERLLWHKPDNIPLNRELANLYLRRTDPRRALQKLQTCFKSDPRDIETLSLLAQAFQALDQKGKTVSVLKEMARVLVEVGNRREAEDVHRRILTFVPNDPDSRAFLNDAASQVRGGPAQTAPVADQVLEPPPRRPAVRGMLNPTGSIPIVVKTKDLDAVLEMSDADELEMELDDQPMRVPAPSGWPPMRPRLGEGGADLSAELSIEDDSYEVESSAHGEAHSEEIVKILTETDVYVKYGLHQKAIDHLGKVFQLDPQNREAQERLKDILLHQGRIEEAVAALCRLAEQCGSVDPERAEMYLREVIRIDPNSGRALELAERYRLDLAGSEEVEIVDDRRRAVGDGSGLMTGTGEGAAVMTSGPRATGSVASSARPVPGPEAGGREELDFDDFDLDSEELDVQVVAAAADVDVGYAAPERAAPFAPRGGMGLRGGQAVPQGPNAGFESDGFEFELDDDEELEVGSAELMLEGDPEAPHYGGMNDSHHHGMVAAVGEEGSGATVEVAIDQVEEAVSIADLDSDELDFDSAPVGSDPLSPIPRPPPDLDERRRGHRAGEDLPFDPHDARLFDAEPGFDEDDALAAFLEDDQSGVTSGAGPGASDAARQRYDLGLDGGELTSDGAPHQAVADPTYRTSVAGASTTTEIGLDVDGETVGDPDDVGDVDAADESAGTSLEDDLDEADFFVSQGLWDEARDILLGLLHRHAHHPLVSARLRDIEAMSAGGAPVEEAPELVSPRPASESPGRQHAHSSPAMRPARPVVMLENPIEDSDADTHFDLGLAYKEMGLHDEAIKAFHKVLSSSRREVQSHMMIGLCHRGQGNLSEAINQFKAGLYVDKITSAEKFGLYYEIGSCYEDLDDPQEALYYYEMVLKKEHGYRDVIDRVAAIRASLVGAPSGQGGKRQSTLDAETDAALDHLKR